MKGKGRNSQMLLKAAGACLLVYKIYCNGDIFR
jgi:hypothetical protein